MVNGANEKILFLGASRGLGAAVLDWINLHSRASTLLISRRPDAYIGKTERLALDFSKPEGQQKTLEVIERFFPSRIFYFAGGGPFGPFENKEWKDQQWALDVSLIFPARLIHFCFQQGKAFGLNQLILTGSSVAESRPDPYAASYAMAKHGLLGLISSLKSEESILDLRLFSPHYMDTDLLPKNAWPRQSHLHNLKLWDTKDVAEKFGQWAFYENSPWHYQLENKT